MREKVINPKIYISTRRVLRHCLLWVLYSWSAVQIVLLYGE
jgi:hypothetical protein